MKPERIIKHGFLREVPKVHGNVPANRVKFPEGISHTFCCHKWENHKFLMLQSTTLVGDAGGFKHVLFSSIEMDDDPQ